jgi:hypothetical protein
VGSYASTTRRRAGVPGNLAGTGIRVGIAVHPAGGVEHCAFRHALERLSRSAYLDDGYFGRWLNAAELVLTESRHFGAVGG